MCFLFSGLFWGAVIILLGLSVILNAVFHIHIPLFRVIVGLILIYFGVKCIAGPSWRCHTWKDTAMFSDANVAMPAGQAEYSVIFGRATIDTASAASGVRIKTVFGASTVRIPKNVPTAVRIKTAFGRVRLPNGNDVSFGNFIYKNKACETAADTAAIRTIHLHVVFGESIVEEE